MAAHRWRRAMRHYFPDWLHRDGWDAPLHSLSEEIIQHHMHCVIGGMFVLMFVGAAAFAVHMYRQCKEAEWAEDWRDKDIKED